MNKHLQMMNRTVKSCLQPGYAMRSSVPHQTTAFGPQGDLQIKIPGDPEGGPLGDQICE